MFEDLPRSPVRDQYLSPVATLLRYWFGSASERRAAAAERAYASLIADLRSSWHGREVLLARSGVPASELTAELKDLLIALEQRLDGYADAASESAEAADEGLALAAKLDRLLSDFHYGRLAPLQRKLEHEAVRHA